MTRMAVWRVLAGTLCLLSIAAAVSAVPAETSADQAKINKHLETGKKALQKGKYEKAIRAFEKATELSVGGSSTAFLGLGTALWRTYEAIPPVQAADRVSTLARAESAFRKALDLTGGDLPFAWSNLALVLERQGSLAEAESALEECLKRDPNNESAQARLSELRTQREWTEFDQRWLH